MLLESPSLPELQYTIGVAPPRNPSRTTAVHQLDRILIVPGRRGRRAGRRDLQHPPRALRRAGRSWQETLTRRLRLGHRRE